MSAEEEELTAKGRTVTKLTELRCAQGSAAHPVRMALMGLLRTEGPPTATLAAELLGAAGPGTCSFHLRQLAKYGLVEEADGGTWRGEAVAGDHDVHCVGLEAGDSTRRPPRRPAC